MNKYILLLFYILFLVPQLTFSEELQPEKQIKNQIEVQNKLPYNFESTYRVPIKMGILDPISTKDKLIEGEIIKFKILNDTYCKRRTILKKDEIVTARIETIITSGMNGFPAEIILGNFEIPNLESSKLVDYYTKKGQNRCFIVYPLKWALTIIPLVGSLTNFIMGGHARIKTSDIITIYYYPDWE